MSIRYYRMNEWNRSRILAKRRSRVQESQTMTAMRPLCMSDTRDDVYCHRCNVVIEDEEEIISKRTSPANMSHYHEACARAVNLI